MRRAITTIVAIGLLVAGSYGFRPVSDTTETAPPSALEQTPIPRLGEVERLISVFEQRVAQNGDPLDMSELGRLHLERAELVDDLGDYGSAITSLEKAVSLAPEDRVAGLRLAQSYLAVHRFDEALGLASSLAASDTTDAAARLAVADAQFELGDAEAAAHSLEEVAAVTGEIPEVLTRRAQQADSMGDVTTALVYAEEALRKAEAEGSEPRRLAFHLTFAAHFLNDLGRYEQAETMLERAIEVDPTWSSSRATLGTVLMSDGRLDEAFTAYERAAALSPDPGTLAILGDLSVALGDDERANAFYDRVEPAASETKVHQDAYRRTMARYLADHDLEPERALELAETDVSQRSDPFGLDTYAWALYRAGQIEEARSQIDKVLAVGLRDPQILYHSGLIALAEGNEEQARVELAEALDKAPLFHPLQAPHARSVLESLEG